LGSAFLQASPGAETEKTQNHSIGLGMIFIKKVAKWFTIMGRELHDPTILAENVYNMDETGILLSFLASRKYVVQKTICENVDVQRSSTSG
jgi:hypothetical protein